MNLVQLIKDQLSGSVLEQLSSLIGASEGTTRSAVGAAVPALLSALSSMTSSSTGAQKLVSALGQFSGGSIENLVPKQSNQPGSLLEKGIGILNSLFGNSTLSAIVNAIARFATIAPGATQKLLGYLAPLVLGAIAARFSGNSVTAQGLSSLFVEQKSNIASALPSGLSLSDVPGLSAASSAVRTAAGGVQAAGPSMMKWLLPLLGLVALGLGLWWFTQQAPTVAPDVPVDKGPVATPPVAVKAPIADVTRLSTSLTDTFKTLTETLTSVKDVASAEAALPKLQEVGPTLDTAKLTLDKLSDAAKTTITTIVKSSQAKLKELVDKVLAIPGVGEKIKAVVDAIMEKISALAGPAGSG